MNWDKYIRGFITYLKIEKSLSLNSVNAYRRDIAKLYFFLEEKKYDLTPDRIDKAILNEFLVSLGIQNINPRSQARIISGLKSFYKYLLLEDFVKVNPAELLEGPKLGRILPDTLSIEEINSLINAVDLSKPEGQRNRAILETLYS